MAEILASIAATSTLLEQSIKVIKDIKKARDASKSHKYDMSKPIEELESTEKIVESVSDLIKKIRGFETENMLDCSKQINEKGVELCAFVTKISSGKGFWHKFFFWQSEKKELDEKVEDVRMALRKLHDAIITANLSMTTDIHNHLIVDKPRVVEANAELQEVLGKEHELNIAKIIKDKVPDDNGKVILNQEDRDKLEQLAEATGGKQRTIRNNTTRYKALQFNAPIGIDLWKDLDQLDIHDNTAEGQSRQFNYAQTMDVYRDQMAMVRKPLDYSLIAILVAVVTALYMVSGK